MAASHCFDRIASNDDVMIYIYNFLNFGDQLRLAKVNADLGRIFRHHIWPMDYDQLKLIEFDDVYIVSNGTTDTDRKLLPTRFDLLSFLHFYGDSVSELSIDLTVLPVSFLRNVVKLNCHVANGGGSIGELVSRLPDLEDLQMDFDEDQPGAKIQILLRLVKLKTLRLRHITVSLKAFWKIATQLPLEILELGLSPQISARSHSLKPHGQNSALRELTISEQRIDNKMLTLLSKFENLEVLTISLRGRFSSEMLALQKLNRLTIEYSDFSLMSYLKLPPNLETLHLRHCAELSLDELQQFLHEHSKPRLIEFVSVGTPFGIKTIRDIQISSHLQRLDIEGLDMDQFREPFAKNSALQNLSLHPSTGFIIGINFITIRSLKFCQNLHTLDMAGQHLALDTLLNLRNLQRISLHLILPNQWFYLMSILQELPLLRYIKVQQIRSSDSIPPPPVMTNIENLMIFNLVSCDEATLGFWFDMFSINPQLQLHLSVHLESCTDVHRLIHHEKFPKLLRKIQICGFTLGKLNGRIEG